MPTNKLGRTLAMGVSAVALFYALSALSMPVTDRRQATATSLGLTLLMLGQAVLYWFGAPLRARAGMAAYVALQAVVVFAVGIGGALFPVGLGLYAALLAETVTLAGSRWGTVPITIGAIVVFGANAILSSNLYFGATAALLLSVTSVIAHAVAALIRRRNAPLAPAENAVAAPNGVSPAKENGAALGREWDLTTREEDVLRELVNGSRSSAIAAHLGIAERTVKAHLASIYQKMGVESRTAAVAVALKGRSKTESA